MCHCLMISIMRGERFGCSRIHGSPLVRFVWMCVHAVGKDWISRHAVSLILVSSCFMYCHAVGKDRISRQIMYVIAVFMYPVFPCAWEGLDFRAKRVFLLIRIFMCHAFLHAVGKDWMLGQLVLSKSIIEMFHVFMVYA